MADLQTSPAVPGVIPHGKIADVNKLAAQLDPEFGCIL
jgi:hypothetical protein